MKLFTPVSVYVPSSLILKKPFGRHHICSSIYDMGLRGKSPNILQNLLLNRTLLVRVQNQASSLHSIQNGVPQGKVLSVLLFSIAIDDITKCVHFPLTRRHFVDDYNKSIRVSDPIRAFRLLHQALDSIPSWASKHGIRFSPH